MICVVVCGGVAVVRRCGGGAACSQLLLRLPSVVISAPAGVGCDVCVVSAVRCVWCRLLRVWVAMCVVSAVPFDVCMVSASVGCDVCVVSAVPFDVCMVSAPAVRCVGCLRVCVGRLLCHSRWQVQLRMENERYLRKHPELGIMLDLFTQSVLHTRPADIRAHAAGFFADPSLRDVVAEHRARKRGGA